MSLDMSETSLICPLLGMFLTKYLQRNTYPIIPIIYPIIYIYIIYIYIIYIDTLHIYIYITYIYITYIYIHYIHIYIIAYYILLYIYTYNIQLIIIYSSDRSLYFLA